MGQTASFTAELVSKIQDFARQRLGSQKADAFAPFVEGYLQHVPPRDVRDETVENLFGAIFSHWRLAATRPAGASLVRVYNPRLTEHGWRCEHTVVEIVTDNMPFLVDSVTAALVLRELASHRLVHPMFAVRRDRRHALVEVRPRGELEQTMAVESFIHVEVTHISGDALDELRTALEDVLASVRAAVEDWRAMREQCNEMLATLDATLPGRPADQVSEIRAFLDWLRDDHFTFLGHREFTFAPGAALPTIVPDSGLGILRDPAAFVIDEAQDPERLPRAIRAFVARDEALTLTKSDKTSVVHRSVPMDIIGLRRFDGEGRVVGLRMFVGLFTAAAYNRSPNSIPIMRRKIRDVIERAGFDPLGHDGKTLLNILETFPRDELFQVSVDHLFHTALGVLHLQERPQVALFMRRDDYERFVTCLVYVPRDRYTTRLRKSIVAVLEKAFDGRIANHAAEMGSSPLARLYLTIRTATGQIPDYDPANVEASIVDVTRTWSDRLLESLISAHGEEAAHHLHRLYGSAFPAGYQEIFSADVAVADIDKIEAVLSIGSVETMIYRPFDAEPHCMRFKIYHPGAPMVLSDVLPMLEHLGLKVLDEVPHAVTVGAGGERTVYLHDFGLAARSGMAIDLETIRDPFHDAFLKLWDGEAESDHFNTLVLEAGLTGRQVVILRACAKFLRQAGITFSQSYMEQVLIGNPKVARDIVALFFSLFDPAEGEDREARAGAIRQRIAAELDAVVSADDDRILRRFVNCVEAMLRTNYFQPGADGQPKSYVSFKFDSRALDDLPLPRPMVEVFVYSPRMEGIHLRGGKVARGGIRWSDRREDFRTEILGLMKAQQVKNAVIVPVGAKGGFVVKRPPGGGDREAVQNEGIACYRMLVQGLLDITDNRVGGGVVPPVDVIRRDDDDPYLVVAADKGTATFSDIANALSNDYGFWLGDAFASGGSQGYDHKKMGITAKGAWESVKRHFRELGTNIQEEPFTVVGVGDMSGDVFGNGMLLSPCIKLVAAFNHLHIFVDPDPDPAVSFAERQRLFELPRSAWSDYATDLLSPGGRIFDRRAKTLTLTPEIRARFGLRDTQMTPPALIRALLKAEVDLLWFGGIGTYVKAADESHADAGDRANDGLRVDAEDLRCKVIGEGANLGLTQQGRIAYAARSGRINTDFIDNSAGVDCSDHEVNIKILLDAVVTDGDMTGKQRNALLEQMTDEVAALVLRDNYLQTQAITLIAAEGAAAIDDQIRLMRLLEGQGRLDRGVEALPDDETLAERAAAGQGPTRPEIAVLFAYCKLWLYDHVIESDLPDDKHMADDVVRYFPTPLQQRFGDRIAGHRLRRELIATSLTNSLINRVGGTFVSELSEKSAMPPIDIARAYIIARDVFRAREIWEKIEALDNAVPAAVQTDLHRDVQRLLERTTMWFLRNGGTPIDITANVEAYRAPLTTVAERIATVLPEDVNARILHRAERFESEGVPGSLARRVAYLIVLPSGCDIVRIARMRELDGEAVARLYYAVGDLLGFGWLRYQAERLPAASYWQKLALSATVEELYASQSALTTAVIDAAGTAGDGAVEDWAAARGPQVARMRGLLAELEGTSPVDLSMLTVASRQLGALVAC